MNRKITALVLTNAELMRNVIFGLVSLTILGLPLCAHAQVGQQALSGTTPSIACANGGDIHAVETLSGNTTIYLPPQISGCNDGQVAETFLTQGSSNYSVTFAAGGNAQCTASAAPFSCCTGSGTGTCSAATVGTTVTDGLPPMPPASGNTILYQFKYDLAHTTWNSFFAGANPPFGTYDNFGSGIWGSADVPVDTSGTPTLIMSAHLAAISSQSLDMCDNGVIEFNNSNGTPTNVWIMVALWSANYTAPNCEVMATLAASGDTVVPFECCAYKLAPIAAGTTYYANVYTQAAASGITAKYQPTTAPPYPESGGNQNATFMNMTINTTY